MVRCSGPRPPMKTMPSSSTTTPEMRVSRSRHCTRKKPGGADHGAGEHEDDREAEHEERGAERERGRSGAGAGRPVHAADVAEVAGHERQHAGRRERQRACGERDRDARAAARPGRRGRSCVAGRTSPSAISVSRIDGSAWPSIRAVTRPSLSSTSVVGVGVRLDAPGEGQLDGAVVRLVEDARVRHAVLLLERLRLAGLVAHVDADELHALALVLRRERLQGRRLASGTGRSPRTRSSRRAPGPGSPTSRTCCRRRWGRRSVIGSVVGCCHSSTPVPSTVVPVVRRRPPLLGAAREQQRDRERRGRRERRASRRALVHGAARRRPGRRSRSRRCGRRGARGWSRWRARSGGAAGRAAAARRPRCDAPSRSAAGG